MKFREVPLTALPDAGLIPGCGMLSSLRLSTQHILLFSQYRNTISLCHFTHVKAVSTSEYSISTYQLSGFLIERLEMGLNAWEEIINHRYLLFLWEGMDLVLLVSTSFFLVFYSEFQSVHDFGQKWAFSRNLGGHHSLTRGPPIPSGHIFSPQLHNCLGRDGTCKFPGRRSVCDPRWGGHGWVQDII